MPPRKRGAKNSKHDGASPRKIFIGGLAKDTSNDHAMAGDLDRRTPATSEVIILHDYISHPEPSCPKRSRHQALEIDKEIQPVVVSTQKDVEINEDGILCSILSFSKLKETVGTSILSRKWKNLWTYNPNLTFDAFNMLEINHLQSYPCSDPFLFLSSINNKVVLSRRSSRFIRSVNEFLHHHQGFGVKKLTVQFNLNKEHTEHLDKWVNFAIRSGAKKLALHLYWPTNTQESQSTIEPYDFPFHLFDNGRGSSVEELSLGFCNINMHATFTGFSSLKRLQISSIYITSLQIDILLSYCFVIEFLSIEHCHGLVNLDISHRRLETLSLFNCEGLMEVEFGPTPLKVFHFIGDWMMLSLKNAPRVVTAAISLDHHRGVDLTTNSYLKKLDSYLPQLETLSLSYISQIEVGIMSNSYKFAHLKQLHLGVRGCPNFDALGLAQFLHYVPLLEKFCVQMLEPWKKLDGPQLVPEMTHMKLRQFAVEGFDGSKGVMKLVLYVMRNAVALELLSMDGSIWQYFPGPKISKVFGPTPFSERARLDAYRELSATPRSPSIKLVLL